MFNFLFKRNDAWKTLSSDLQTNDDKYAKVFIEDPIAFENATRDHAIAKKMAYAFGLTHRKLLPIFGGFTLLASDAVRPSHEHLQNIGRKGMKFIDASENGAFVIYSTCCEEPNNTMFLKVAKSNRDSLEVEALALKLIKRYVPEDYQRYFLTYSSSGKIICKYEYPSIYLPINAYMDGELFKSPAKFVDKNGYKSMAFLMTHAIPSGISLSTLIDSWDARYASHEAIDSMSIFYKSNLYKDIIEKKTKMSQRGYISIAKRLHKKLEQFIAGVVHGSATIGLSHGDLHTANVMYDALRDNFVVIDFGRAAIDLKSKSIGFSTVWNEYLKIQTFEISSKNEQLTEANVNYFFKIFQNYNARVDFDEIPKQFVKYGMLLDLAGMCSHVERSLSSTFKAFRGPSDIVSVYRYNNMKYYKVMTVTAIKKFIKHSHSLYSFMLCLFALIVNSCLHTNNELFDEMRSSSTMLSSDQIAIPFYLVTSSSGDTIFYEWGQPNSEILYTVFKTLEKNCKNVNYFKFLKQAIDKELANGDHSEISTISGGSPSIRKGLRLKNVKRHLSYTTIPELTKKNYANRAKRMVHNDKKHKGMSVSSVLMRRPIGARLEDVKQPQQRRMTS